MKKLKLNFARFFAVSLLVAGLVWIWVGKIPALAYFFSGQSTTLQGVIGNRAGSVSGFLPGTFWLGPIQIRNILGQPYFIAYEQQDHAQYEAFSRRTIQGRLVDFGPDSNFKSVRKFFENRLGMIIPQDSKLLIVGEEPFVFWRYPILMLLSCLLVLGVLWLNLFRK